MIDHFYAIRYSWWIGVPCLLLDNGGLFGIGHSNSFVFVVLLLDVLWPIPDPELAVHVDLVLLASTADGLIRFAGVRGLYPYVS